MAALTVSPALARTHHYHRVVHHRAAAAPMIAPADDTGFGPTAPGVSSILIDASSGQVISAASADTPRYPASLTKLMTLDLAFQALAQGRMTLDTQIPVSAHASAVEPVKLGLQPGDTISVHDAILAMTTMSANDAATALGEYLGGGSEAQCGEMMTARAHALGMAQSQFFNASGLPNPNQVTTARDLSLLARDIVVNYPQFQTFFEVTSFDFEGRQVYSNNGMLKTYPGATGMKTGYTILARHNLITSASRNGHTLIGVVLHEPSWGTSYTQMTAMLDSGFGGHQAGPNTVIATANPPRPKIPAIQPTAPTTQVVAVASKTHAAAVGGWVAQLGVFTHMTKARTEALAVRQMRGQGIARIAKVQHNGHTLWSAQLAGLSFSAAHATCDALTARGSSCQVIRPASDHLALAATPDDGT